jgi:error-prone DNA polymerase
VLEDAESPLPDMSLAERLGSDLVGTSLTVGPHPMALYRQALRERGVVRAADLPHLEDGARVRVAGAVICRQRPGTAKGFLFMTLEDETGLVNVTVRPDMFERDHDVLVSTSILEIDGVLQARDGLTVRAWSARPAPVEDVKVPSRDFH